MIRIKKEDLEAALRQLPDVEVVDVIVDRFRLIGTVVSRSFRGQDEAERQIAVYHHLDLTLGDEFYKDVEFVFTNTPEEYAALMAGGRKAKAKA
jgi:acid stress-induced BolA-like protein IbaG/YrbA